MSLKDTFNSEQKRKNNLTTTNFQNLTNLHEETDLESFEYIVERNKENNKCLGIQGKFVSLSDPTDKFTQQWSFDKKTGQITNRSNFNVLSLDNDVKTDNVRSEEHTSELQSH